jgi:hypothetical protein
MTAEERIKAFIKVAQKNNLTPEGDYVAGRENKWPELYIGYTDAILERENINIHSTRKVFPELSFRRLLTNMDENGIKWLKENYQPITQSVFSDFDSTAKRAINNVYIDDNGVDSEVMDYLSKELPKYDSFFNYFKELQPTLRLRDAMSVFTAAPVELPLSITEDGVTFIDGDINPTPQYFECFRVIHYERGKECLILRPEKSLVNVGNTTKQVGLIFEWYDKERIIRFVQTGRRHEYTFSIAHEFEHELEMMPAIRAGGMAEIIDNEVVYSSYFSPALPHLNYAMFDGIFLQAQKRKSAFPTQVMATENCNYEDAQLGFCTDGILRGIKDGAEVITDCPKCDGTGKRKHLNPFSTFYVPIKNGDEQGSQLSVHDALTYVSPSVETLKFLREEVEQQINSAYEVIKTRRSNVSTGNVTATEKGIDLKATQAFIISFSMGLIAVGNLLIKSIVDMKWGKDVKQSPTILGPQHLDFKTVTDYIFELAEAQKAGLPPFVISRLVSDMMYAMSDGNDISTKVVETVIAADTLYALDNTKAALQRDNVQKWQLVLHTASFSIIYDIMMKDSSFIEKDLADRVKIVIDAAKVLTPQTSTAAIDALL